MISFNYFGSWLSRFVVVCWCLQGAPEGVIDRCEYMRVGSERQPLDAQSKQTILAKIKEMGTGRDTLRCLAIATRDNPPSRRDMKLEDSSHFASYEVWFKICTFLRRGGRSGAVPQAIRILIHVVRTCRGLFVYYVPLSVDMCRSQ